MFRCVQFPFGGATLFVPEPYFDNQSVIYLPLHFFNHY